MHGLFNQIRLNLITIENAEHILFTPYIMNKLKKNNVSEEILSLVHEGTELEDLKSLNILSDEELSRLIKSSPDSCVKCYTMFLPFLLIKIDVFS